VLSIQQEQSGRRKEDFGLKNYIIELTMETKGERAIRRLLRHRHSQEYFSENGWTKDPEEARSFADSLEAAQTCVQWGLGDMEMVLRVAGGSSDLFCTELWSAPRRATFNERTGGAAFSR
jgi:hypothetical protein